MCYPNGIQSWSFYIYDANGIDVSRHGDYLSNPLRNGAPLIDLNRDGFIESVEVRPHSAGRLLSIYTAEPQPRPIFAVVHNWSWHYDLVDPDGTGVLQLRLGPRSWSKGGIDPKVTYRWDPRATYVGPAGGDRDHFRVIDAAKVPEELDRLADAKISFPEVRADADVEDWEQLLKSVTRMPEGFWNMPPKAAALAMANANRSDKHKERYRLAVDDRDGAAPPDVCTVSLSDYSTRCGFAGGIRDIHYFLHCKPQRSYFVRAIETADLEFRDIPYEKARQVAHALWWLDRVRSQTMGDEAYGTGWSTADGDGVFRFRSPAKEAPAVGEGKWASNIRISAHIWSDGAPLRWRNAYAPEICLNFAQHLLGQEVPGLLKPPLDQTRARPLNLWGDWKPPEEPRPRRIPPTEQEVADLLRVYKDDPQAYSPGLATVAATVAGNRRMTALAPLLQELLSALPAGVAPGPVQPPASRRGGGQILPSDIPFRPSAPLIRPSDAGYGVAFLRDALEDALRKLKAVADPPAPQK